MPNEQPPEEAAGLVVRDRRRIDPETGRLRQSPEAAGGSEPAGAPAGTGDEETTAAESAAAGPTGPPSPEAQRVGELEARLAERTADLQRLQAEFRNYKRRVERDREAVREQAVGAVLLELLPVLDDIGRARDHGELSGGFKAVAEALETTVAKLGLVRYGDVGDAFDPRIHEALMHAYADDVTGPTCSAVVQPGYRLGERVLRAARVAVTEPTAGLPEPDESAESAAATESAPGEEGTQTTPDPAEPGQPTDRERGR